MNDCPHAVDVPWYRNGTLPAEAHRRFAQHLGDCPACRAELALDERLAGHLEFHAANILPAPQLAWRRLEARLGDDAPEVPRTPDATGRPRTRLLQVAVAAQAAAILALVVVLWSLARQPHDEPYRTLGAPEAAAGAGLPLVRVVLAPGHDGDAAGLAASLGAEVAGRYEGTEIYTFAVRVAAGESRAGRLDEVITALRRHPGVRMAEPVTDPQVAGEER